MPASAGGEQVEAPVANGNHRFFGGDVAPQDIAEPLGLILLEHPAQRGPSQVGIDEQGRDPRLGQQTASCAERVVFPSPPMALVISRQRPDSDAASGPHQSETRKWSRLSRNSCSRFSWLRRDRESDVGRRSGSDGTS